MSIQAESKPTVPSAADCAEAAAWIAKLHGEDRSSQLEAGFRRWLAASKTHQTAFDMANDLWADSARFPKSEYPVRLLPEGGMAFTWPKILTAAAVACIGLMSTIWVLRDPSIETGIGELRNIALGDGTRVALNTATHIEVHYDNSARTVVLKKGEAFFDVAKRADRPFIVQAAGQKITALGTAFVVRQEKGNVAVTLIDGKVAVSSLTSAATALAADSASSATAGEPTPSHLTMSPGQRLTLGTNTVAKIDRPQLERVTAWQRGQVILDHTSLADAIGEMNRYSSIQLVIESVEAANVQVTGVFRAGDSRDFASAVATSYGLKLTERSGTMVLSGVPVRK